MAYNPYVAASTEQNLLQALSAGKFGQQIGKAKKEERMGKDVEEFEAEIKRLEKEAREKAEENKGLFGGLNLLGALLGPAGSGIISGLSGLAQGKQQQKAMEKLLNISPKYAKTHLRKGYSSYMDNAKRMQIESGDIYKDALKSGLTSWAMSKAMYGGEEATEGAVEAAKAGEKAKGIGGKPGGFGGGQGKLAKAFGKDAPIIDETGKLIAPGKGGAFGVIGRGGGFGGGGVKALGETMTRPGTALKDDSGIMTLLALLGSGLER